MTYKVSQESRDRLYHNRFRYAVRCYVPDASILRQLDHAAIDKIIQWRNTRPRRGFFPLLVRETEIQLLHSLCDLMLQFDEPWHKTCYMDHLYLYTNSLRPIDMLERSGLVPHFWVSEAVVDKTPNTVRMCFPRFTHRSYFRSRMLDQEQFALLRDFVQARPQQLQLSKTFRQRLRDTSCFVHYHYHMDHNDPHIPFLLEMVCPGLIRSTMPIVAK